MALERRLVAGLAQGPHSLLDTVPPQETRLLPQRVAQHLGSPGTLSDARPPAEWRGDRLAVAGDRPAAPRWAEDQQPPDTSGVGTVVTRLCLTEEDGGAEVGHAP